MRNVNCYIAQRKIIYNENENDEKIIDLRFHSA
jgi:hypothetical protein